MVSISRYIETIILTFLYNNEQLAILTLIPTRP